MSRDGEFFVVESRLHSANDGAAGDGTVLGAVQQRRLVAVVRRVGQRAAIEIAVPPAAAAVAVAAAASADDQRRNDGQQDEESHGGGRQVPISFGDIPHCTGAGQLRFVQTRGTGLDTVAPEAEVGDAGLHFLTPRRTDEGHGPRRRNGPLSLRKNRHRRAVGVLHRLLLSHLEPLQLMSRLIVWMSGDKLDDDDRRRSSCCFCCSGCCVAGRRWRPRVDQMGVAVFR